MPYAGKALLFGDPVTAAEAQAATGGYALAPGSGYTSAATSSPMAAAKASAALAGLVSWVKQSVLAPAAAGKHVEDMDDEERQLRQVRVLMLVCMSVCPGRAWLEGVVYGSMGRS